MSHGCPDTVDPERQRRLDDPKLWLGLAMAVGFAYYFDCLDLLVRAEHGWAVLVAFPLGHLLLGLALALNRLSLRFGWYGMVGSIRLLYRPYGGETMVYYWIVALTEEIVFRAVPLTVVGDSWVHVTGFAALFSIQHLLSKRKPPIALMLVDFFLFGLILGALFVWLGDLWPLVIAHWVRNGSVAKIYTREPPAATSDRAGRD